MTRRLISILIINTWGLILTQGDVILSSPINIAVREGKMAEFECQTKAEIRSWSFTPVGSSVSITFYHRRLGKLSNLTSFYNSTSPDGRVSVKTDSVRMEDAGIYECSIQQPKGNETTLEQRNAQLIVLASEPKCWRNESDDRFRCSVDYRGNWAPLMEWKRDGPGESEVTGGLQIVVTNNQSFSSILFVGGEETSVSIAGFICQISFSFNGSSTGTAANNVPKYTPICPDSDKSSTSRVSSTGDDRASNTGTTNRGENKFFEIIIATGVVVCILFIVLIFVSTRNFKKYRSGSVRPREIDPIVQNSVQGLRMEGVSPRSENLPKFKGADSLVSVRSSRTLSDKELQKLGREECNGADGTVYMKMGTVDSNMNSLSRSSLRPSRHEMTIYASIDHTVKPLAYPYPPAPIPNRY